MFVGTILPNIDTFTMRAFNLLDGLGAFEARVLCTLFEICVFPAIVFRTVRARNTVHRFLATFDRTSECSTFVPPIAEDIRLRTMAAIQLNLATDHLEY